MPSTTARPRSPPDLFCLTFNGLSKAYRVAGFRSGWLLVSGPKQHAKNYLEGLATLAGMRLCPNVPGQYAIQAALGGRQSITDLILPGGRLHEQRDRAWQRLNEIPGVSCVKPRGALYAFPRLDPAVHKIHDDEQAGPRPAAAGEDPGGPGHRVQLAAPRSLPHPHPAARR